MNDAILCALIWIFVFASLWRGYHRTGHLDRYGAVTWTIFVAMALVFTFRVSSVPPLIDGIFGGYPITFLLSLLAVLGAITAYSLSLKWLIVRNPEIYPLKRIHLRLIWTVPLVASSIGGAAVLHLSGILSSFQMQYASKWTIEGDALLQTTFVFMPINFCMVRQEQIFPMKIKHLATLVLCFTFALSALLSVVSIPVILSTGKINPGPTIIPRGQIAAVCLGILHVALRWLAMLAVPIRLYYFGKLARLDSRLLRLVRQPYREPMNWRLMYRSEHIEIAIYIRVIDILDNYRLVEPCDSNSQTLVEQIQALVTEAASYDDLVEGLCRVRW